MSDGSGDRHALRMALVVMGLAALAAMPAASSHAAIQPPPWPLHLGTLPVSPKVLDGIGHGGTPEVIVALNDGGEPAEDDATLQAKVAAVQERVLAELGEDFALIYRYGEVPALAGRVTAAGLTRLAEMDEVVAVEANDRVRPMLAESVPLIRADKVWTTYGLTGEGVTVAVLDTGIDNSHPDFEGKIVDQHCYSSSRSCAPSNTAESANAQDEYGHGTMVSGIILSKGRVSHKGVAPDARLAMARVFRDSGGAFDDDIVAGLDWVLRNAVKHNIHVVNMSLGGGAARGVNCDSQEPTTKSAFQRLVARGVAIFVATGNNGLTDLVSSPACISNSIAVGASYDAAFNPASYCPQQGAVRPMDIVCFTNRGRAMDLLAPGFWITSDKLGGGIDSGAGTSFAAPMAAGVAALMFEANPDLRPSDVERILKDTGTLVKHPESGDMIPFINAEKAVAAVITPRATNTARPMATPTPTASAVANTPVPTSKATATPVPTATPTPTTFATAGPSPTPTETISVPPTRRPTDPPGTPAATEPAPTAAPPTATATKTDRWRIFVPWCVKE